VGSIPTFSKTYAKQCEICKGKGAIENTKRTYETLFKGVDSGKGVINRPEGLTRKKRHLLPRLIKIAMEQEGFSDITFGTSSDFGSTQQHIVVVRAVKEGINREFIYWL